MAQRILCKVMDAIYIEESDCIVLSCENNDQKIKHQLHSSLFRFGNKDKVAEMKKTAELFKGKFVWVEQGNK